MTHRTPEQGLTRERGEWLDEHFYNQHLTYRQWMEKEGLPVHTAFLTLDDIWDLPRKPWARLGGNACFIELEGTVQARKLMYLAEIPVGGAWEPEKHLYDELFYIWQGRGLAEVWNQGQKNKVSFEWGTGSLFAVPLNTWHRLVNGGREPVLIFAVTSAPLVMNALRDIDFIFHCDTNFTDRYKGEADYFTVKGEPPSWEEREQRRPIWDTNFIPDLRATYGEGGVGSGLIKMAGWSTVHSMGSPVGTYFTCHYHGGGAALLIVAGEGYDLLWDRKYGIHPFQDGYRDKVHRVDFKKGSLFSPPHEWFHTHCNIGREGVHSQMLAVTGGGLGIELPSLVNPYSGFPGGVSVRDGGCWVNPEDRDPELQRIFEEECRKKGITVDMPRVIYRTDPIKLYWM